MSPMKPTESASPVVAEDAVAAAVDAAPYDDRPESEEERAAVAEARAEPDGYVPREEVARVVEAWSRPKSA